MAEYRVTVNYDSLDSGFVQVDYDVAINGANLSGQTSQTVADDVANAIADAIEGVIAEANATHLSSNAKRYYSATQIISLS